ncbi:MAG TPA: hypothetical protein VJ725_18105 [Thermoanaerobaculia bacterium]|nr:hypothetical protein [Thermoanaerobaculia bacterium]
MVKREKVAEDEIPRGHERAGQRGRAEADSRRDRTAYYKADDLPEALKLFMKVYAEL